MDDEDNSEQAINNLSNEDISTIQITVLSFAVEALIATHPNRSEVRRVFDQMYAQFQGGPAMLGASPDAAIFARQLIEKIFEEIG